MSENEIDWSSDDSPAPRKKRGIPTWLWVGCGIGCLGVVVLVGVIGFLAKGFIDKASDPDYVWTEVEKVLPHDVRPEGYDAMGGFGFLGTGQFMIDVDDPHAVLMVQLVQSSSELDAMFDPESMHNTGIFGVGKISNAEQGELELQGRSTRYLRFHVWLPEGAREEDPNAGASIRVDVSGGSAGNALVQITAGHSEEPISDETVRSILEPFDVWRGR